MMATSADDLRRIASAHYLTLEGPDASEADVLAAIDWIEESPDHYALVQEVSRFSGLCEQLSSNDLAGVSRLCSLSTAMGGWKWRPPAIAAALAIVIVGLAAVFLHTDMIWWRGQADSVEYFTDVGESKTVTLPDKSRVTLGAASGIRIDYRSSLRRIVLTAGEALFDVAPNKARPFVVETSDGEITALGTEFNVNRTLHSTTVTLIEGRVKAETTQGDDGPVAILRPDTQIEISASGGLSAVREIDADSVLAWTRGTYRYDDAPLGKIAADLNRYYDRTIVLASHSLNEMRFTGAVTLSASGIEQWLQSLEYVGSIKVTVRDDGIIISDSDGPSSERFSR